MQRKQSIPSAAPTPGPWDILDDLLVYRHWRYSGWPHFGQIVVARLDSCWPQGPERRANLELIATAVNACFTLAPKSPIAAARALPALVNAVEDFLEHGEDPNMPLAELNARLRIALREAKGDGPSETDRCTPVVVSAPVKTPKGTHDYGTVPLPR